MISAENPLPTVQRNRTEVTPRIELFHYVFSVCSQKVRGTLAELGVAYGSNEIVILPPQNENYSPQYVRLRLMSEAAKKHRPASAFSGQSSVESEGFDPLVVPTLVDHEEGIVIADSKAICLWLCDNIKQESDLLPDDIRERVLDQVAIGDQTPHVALLYGADPDGDRRPEVMQAVMPGIHAHKIEAVKRNMALAGGDTKLLDAYNQKIAKEEAAASFVIDHEQMRAAIDKVRTLLANLEATLEKSAGQWLFDDRFTLADLFWAVSLYRFLWLGYGDLWENRLPHVEAYSARLFKRPSVQNTIINWPGHPPSERVQHLIVG